MIGGGVDAFAVSRVRACYKSITSTEYGRTQFASAFFAAMFGQSPHLRSLFPAGMEQQRGRLVTAIGYVVDHLDSPNRTLAFLAQLGRDHRKYGVEDRHYRIAETALLSAARTSTAPSAWTDSLEGAWRELIDLIVGTMAGAAAEDDTPAVWGATVVSHRRVLSDLAIIRLEADAPIPYAAGQYLSVQIPQRPHMWRYLSAAIPPNPYGQLEFHVRRVSGGWVSPAMVADTTVGDRWELSSPLGALQVDRDCGEDVLMIGSGTGIAPLRAQVMEMAMRGTNPRVHLFVGGKYPCDLYDIETLWQLSLTNPWLTVVPVIEEDENPWWNNIPVPELAPGLHQPLRGKLGRVVTEFGSWADRQVQVCGSPSMVRTTLFALEKVGTPRHHIKYDPLG